MKKPDEQDRNDPFLRQGGAFLKQQDELQKAVFVQFSNWQELANEIAKYANQGRSPIRKLIVLFHWFGNAPVPESIDLFKSAAVVKTLDSNTLVDAKGQNGPLRSWFTRNAEFIGLGCNCTGVAEFMANNLLRKDAKSTGSLALLRTAPIGNQKYVMGFDIDGDGEFNRATEGNATLAELLAVPNKWQTFNGTR